MAKSSFKSRPNVDGKLVPIADAYTHLTPKTFAVWIRMMLIPESELAKGRANLACILEYSESSVSTILRELKWKGYVELIRGEGIGAVTNIILAKKAVISGPSAFVRLSAGNDPRGRRQSSNKKKPKSKSIKSLCNAFCTFENLEKNNTFLANVPIGKGFKGKSQKKLRKIPTKGSGRSGAMEAKSTSENHPKTKRAKTGRMVTTEGQLIGGLKRAYDRSKSGTALDLSKISKIRDSRKKSKTRSVAKKIPNKLNWGKIDERGQPAITFSPSRSKRDDMISILNRTNRDTTKRVMIDKITQEAARIYTRYRRELLEAKGLKRTSYIMDDGERKYAARFGEHCLRKGVTPTQVLKYWNDNIGNFANARMKLPSLVFLSGPANIETVACAAMDKNGNFTGGNVAVVRHSFSDTSKLDIRLRRGLARAGHDTTHLDDRYLMTIQSSAKTLAMGVNLFVSDDLRPMVEWVAENLYDWNKDSDED